MIATLGFISGYAHDWPEQVRQDVSVTIALWASTNGSFNTDAKTPQESLIFHDVTLGLGDLARKEKWFFSSCAFLPLFIYECLGFSEKQNLARNGAQPLSRIAWHKLSQPIPSNEVPEYQFIAGDTVQIGSNGDSHVQFVLASSSEENVLVAQYGLGFPDGGNVALAQLNRKGLLLRIGARPARRILRLSNLFNNTPRDDMRMAQIPVDAWEHLSAASRDFLTTVREP